MNIELLIESIGLNAQELKKYLVKEVDEFLTADDAMAKKDEFNDILFALRSMSYAKTGEHYKLSENHYEKKVIHRLKTYATISKKDILFENKSIQDIPIGVVHYAFGNFKQPWSHFDPFKNGTEAEIALLTDIEYLTKNTHTNHLIITFDSVDQMEFSIIASSWKFAEGNTVLCRIPDFLFEHAKKKSALLAAEEMLASQVYACLQHVNLLPGVTHHFHSWESGVVLSLPEIVKIASSKIKLFSPYLTIARLNEVVNCDNGHLCTLNLTEIDLGIIYEKKLMKFCDEIILESNKDKDYYKTLVSENKLKIRNFTDKKAVKISPELPADKIVFITGGRPVYEKGFIELCKNFLPIVKWAVANSLEIELDIYCREYKRSNKQPKRVEYIKALEDTCKKLKIDKYVNIYDKVSIGELKKKINAATAMIVPSLYDPFCLMPLYAMEVNKIAFVSKYTGISENIESEEYIYDPLEPDNLLKKLKIWYQHKPGFSYSSQHNFYEDIYLK